MAHSRSAYAAAPPRVLTLFCLALAALFAALLLGTAPAHAAEGDPYRISGNVQLDGEPLERVRLLVDGPGGMQEAETDESGQWRVQVPERNADYVVTLDEETLPEGIAVVDEEDETPNVKEVTVGPGGRVSVNFFIGEGERNVTSFADQFVARLVRGLIFGLMLALAAVGLSLVFGTTGISNFSHAEMVTFGPVAVAGVLSALATLSLPPWAGLLIAVPLAIALSALLGLLLDAVLWRPLRRRRLGIVQLMIVSIGLSLAMRYVFPVLPFLGGGTRQLPYATEPDFTLFGAVTLGVADIVSIVVSLVTIGVFAAWLTYSRIGKATRAVSDNPSLAAASGIDVDRVVRIVWVVAAVLAGIAGILYAYYRPGIRWDMGTGILLLLFAAVTLGGLGTALGALIGALIIGVLVEVSTLWISDDLKFAVALIVLILILLFRPQGILGRRERIG